MKTNKTVSISRKIVYITMLSAFIAFIPLDLVYFLLQRNSVYGQLKEEARQITERLKNNISYPFWTMNEPEIINTINLEMSNKNIHSVLLRHSNGEVFLTLIRNGDEIYNYSVKTDDTLYKTSFFSMTDSILWNNKTIGIVEIYFTNKEINRTISNVFIKTNLITMILMLIVVFVFIINIKKIIVAPILSLEKALISCVYKPPILIFCYSKH
ncbi:MAG: hypothetical protein PHR06_12360 [Candidatus Cloacimonetes bacterium]|nr:hypothetical protein [Candidatus Cloacimonadota bacterium]